MIDLYEAYTKERTGNELFKCDEGFCEYRIEGHNAEIVDMYIMPEHRGKKLSHAICSGIESRAKKLGCKNLLCQVDVTQNFAERSVANNIAYGFKIAALNENLIIFYKEL